MNKVLEKKAKLYNFLLFLISPVLGAILAIKNFHTVYSKYIFVLIIGIFGANIIFNSPTNDGYKHVQELSEYATKTFETYIVESKNILLFKPQDNAHDDIYLHTISFIASQFSTDSTLFFFINGFIFGIFYIGSIQKIYISTNCRWNRAIIVLFIFFIFWKGVEGMTQIRFWTGTWVIFFGLISYLQTNNKYYLILLILGPMIHFGHNISLIAILSALVLSKHPVIVFSTFIGSFIFLFIPADFIVDIFTINELGEHRTSRYVGTSTVGFFTFRQGTSFHARYYLAAGQLFYTILLLYGLFKFDYFKKKNQNIKSIFASCSLLMLTIANIGNISYAINMRFSIMAGIFSTAYLIISYSDIIRKDPNNEISLHFKYLIILLSPLAILVIFTQMSIIGEFLDFRVLVSPFVSGYLGDEPLSIKEFIRSLTGF